MESKKPYLSNTRLGMLSRCGIQYQYRYIDGIIAPPSVPMVRGIAVHDTVRADLDAKRVSGELMADEEVKDIAAEKAKATFDGMEPELTADEKESGREKTRAAVIDTAVALNSLHHSEIAPGIEPVYLERRFRIEIPSCSHDMVGVIDVQEPTKLRDTKTTGKSPGKNEAHNSLQLTVYSLGAKVIDGVEPESLHLDYLVSTKPPKAVSLKTTRTKAHYESLLRRVEQAAKVIESGAFMPASPDHWCCSKKWCGWYDRCPWGSANRVQFNV